MSIDQIMIALTGVIAIWLSQDKSHDFRKYACLFGLVGQPFWFYSSFQAEQWGIFILCFGYTYAWWKGFKVNWLEKEVVEEIA